MRKKANKLLSLALAFVMLVGFMSAITSPAYSATGIPYPVAGGNIYFNKSTGMITDCNESVTAANIPSAIDGTPVTGIEYEAFYCCNNLTSVTIPNSVTRIGDCAFAGCTGLASVNIPESVTAIGRSAFRGTALYNNEENWENGVLYIDNALIDVKKDISGSCVIKDCTRVMAYDVFYGCTGLTSVEIPNGVTSIAGKAFYDCSSLTSVTIPNSVTSIYAVAFHGTALYNDETNWENGVLYIDNVLIDVKKDISGSFSIKDGTRVIAGSAFSNCSGLTSVEIPNSVTSIGGSAFSGCTKLTSVNIPNSVTSIEDWAFTECNSLTSVTIPSSVTIMDGAFAVCRGLTSVTIQYGVTNIGHRTFNSCNCLTSVEIPSSVTYIGKIAFAGCGIKDVYYGGTEAQWNAITIDDNNLWSATIHYTGDDTPTEYAVTTAAAQNGTVTVSPEKAKAGETVTVTPKPDDGYETDAVTVTDKDGKKVSVTKNSDGTYSFAMPEGDVGVSVTFKEKSELSNPFTDVKKGAYYYDAVLWAVNHDPQITTGTSATNFSPNDTCTRGQVVTFLWRAAGCPEPTGSSSPFTDVKPGDYYYKAVLWAVEKNITKGTGATTFSPNDGCTRGQVVTFLHRFENTPSAGSASNPFTDVSSGAYYNAAVLWAVKNDITTGTGAGKFSPDDTCTRGQIVTFLYRDMGEK